MGAGACSTTSRCSPRRLVDLCLEGLKAAGITRVLILVLQDNEAGRSFWNRQGWAAIDQAIPMAIEP